MAGGLTLMTFSGPKLVHGSILWFYIHQYLNGSVCACVCDCMHASNFFISDRGCTNWYIISEEEENLLYFK